MKCRSLVFILLLSFVSGLSVVNIVQAGNYKIKAMKDVSNNNDMSDEGNNKKERIERNEEIEDAEQEATMLEESDSE